MATKEETKRMIEVMQAYVDGKPTEVAVVHSGRWQAAKVPAWDWLHYDYRVKEDMELKAVETFFEHEIGYELTPDARKSWRAVIDAVKRGEIQ